MKIQENISLKSYNTFGIDVNAKYFSEYNSVAELRELLQSETLRRNHFLHIGGGSNLLFLKDFDGVILHSRIKSIEITEEDENSVLLRVGSGLIWDDFVAYCVEKGYYGIENLSLIPGEVGASAVQNIGAYGMEAKDTIEKVEFIESGKLQTKIFNNEQCRYSYRKSIFKEELKGKVIITHVSFRLKKQPAFILDYSHLKEAVLKNGEINLKNIRNTVIEIRESKLPNPKKLGNAGSFFMNPIISSVRFEELQLSYPTMPHYPVSETEVKVPAGWLIDQCNLKGKQFDKVGIYSKQALVIVNFGGASGKDIATVASLIQMTVKKRFGIDIEPEVNFIL
ncbi:MAG: UDP-N-acetylmuramate dehydrogenase [Paludibacteraceae bacterium]